MSLLFFMSLWSFRFKLLLYPCASITIAVSTHTMIPLPFTISTKTTTTTSSCFIESQNLSGVRSQESLLEVTLTRRRITPLSLPNFLEILMHFPSKCLRGQISKANRSRLKAFVYRCCDDPKVTTS